MMLFSKSEKWYDRLLSILVSIAIIASAFHFWPFPSKSLWKLINVSNLSNVTGFLIIVMLAVYSKKERVDLRKILPPISVWMYLVFHLLSFAYSDTLSRPAVYTIKLVLMMIGGYILLTWVFSCKIGIIPWLITISCSICVISSLYTQYIQHSDSCGFFVNTYKYGTYISIMGVFTVSYLLSRKELWLYLLGFTILFALVITVRNIGGIVAIFAGLITALIAMPKESKKKILYTSIVSIVVIIAGMLINKPALLDAGLIEKDGTNLRQRYIEWQAEINMLEKYGITGSGAGSVNDYRSNYYYRLPKLNTLKSYDQNGYLAMSAEVGIMGVLCLVWIICEHWRYILLAMHQTKPDKKHTLSTALLAALVASCVSNLFSSVYYNGVIIAFVIVLSLSKALYLNEKEC